MKIDSIVDLPLSGIKLIKYCHFKDSRGFFTESYNFSQFNEHNLLDGNQVVQINESHSQKNVIRGLHFQWNPYMGKLVRTVSGRMIDLVLDLRPNSSTFKKILAVDMPYNPDSGLNTWIWVPPGFAHGNFFPEETRIEYLCTGMYNQDCETGINPFSDDIDWSICDSNIKSMFDSLKNRFIISDKDKELESIEKWLGSNNGSVFNSL